MQLRVAAARIAAIGKDGKLRTPSSWATYGGLPMGLLAIAATVRLRMASELTGDGQLTQPGSPP